MYGQTSLCLQATCSEDSLEVKVEKYSFPVVRPNYYEMQERIMLELQPFKFSNVGPVFISSKFLTTVSEHILLFVLDSLQSPKKKWMKMMKVGKVGSPIR